MNMVKKPINKEKISKKVNSNIATLNKANSSQYPKKSDIPWEEDYKELLTGDLKPLNRGFLERLGAELIEYARTTEGPLRVEWFFISKRIPYSTARYWAETRDYFKDAYQTAKYILGMRREDGAIRKLFDKDSVFRSLHLYDPEFKEVAKFHAQLKVEAITDAEGRQVIVLPRIVDERMES